MNQLYGKVRIHYSWLFLLFTCLSGCTNSDELVEVKEHSGKAEIPNIDLFKPLQRERPAYDICKELPSIMVPENHDDPLKKVQYRYQIYQTDDDTIDTDAGTIAFMLPGGPGEGAIVDDPGKIPTYGDLKWVLIDPRGVGCNHEAFKETDSSHLTTLNHARDVLEVLSALNPKKYLIYGGSYGTVVGTVVAHLATNDERIPDPISVILEGILGRGDIPIFREVLSFWQEIRTNDPQNELWLTEVEREQLEISDQGWMRALFYLSYFDKVYIQTSFKYFVSELRKHLKSNTISEETANALNAIRVMSEDTLISPIGARRLMGAIGCREIFNMTGGLFTVEGDNIGLTGKNPCGTVTFKPYDSEDYQIVGVPVYYLQGRDDNATTVDNAEHHYEKQVKASAKHYHVVPDAGHSVLGIKLKTCKDEIFKKAAMQESLTSVLDEDNLCKILE